MANKVLMKSHVKQKVLWHCQVTGKLLTMEICVKGKFGIIFGRINTLETRNYERKNTNA